MLHNTKSKELVINLSLVQKLEFICNKIFKMHYSLHESFSVSRTCLFGWALVAPPHCYHHHSKGQIIHHLVVSQGEILTKDTFVSFVRISHKVRDSYEGYKCIITYICILRKKDTNVSSVSFTLFERNRRRNCRKTDSCFHLTCDSHSSSVGQSIVYCCSNKP